MATAARSLIDDRLTELEKTEQLGRAEEWQRAEVWATIDRIERDGRTYVRSESVHRLVQDAIGRARKKTDDRSA